MSKASRPLKRKISPENKDSRRPRLNTTAPPRIPVRPTLTSSRSSTPEPKKTVTTKKVPSWDTRGQMNQLQTKLEETGNEVDEIEKLQHDLQSSVQNQDSILQEAKQKVADLETTLYANKARHEEEINTIIQKFHLKSRELVEQNKRYNEQMQSLDQELDAYSQRYQETCHVLEEEKFENNKLRVTVEKTSAAYADVDAELVTLKMRLQSSRTVLEEREHEVKTLEQDLAEKKQLAQELESVLIEEETNRRKLHNTIQELKGNIRVFCRVRPRVARDKGSQLAEINYSGEDHESIELLEQVSSTLGKSSTKSYAFTFDKVFGPECNQGECFEEISQLVQSALDGYNVCIFAYGQTGSGKTFTMQGPPQPTEETSGMIPRAVHQIYDVTQQLRQFGWEYTMEGTFLEIYNETIHDLLGDTASYGKIKHEIRHEKNGKTVVTDMTSVQLDSPSKVKMMLKKANQNRATGATNLNERSSRSHSVFTLQLTGENKKTGERSSGILNLIDLAGSERLSLSGSVGDRLKETQAINKSLSSLGDVIHALVNKKEGSHIPYRNSKLTWLLRNSLGGNCKTLMFVNISPLAEHFNETLCSLRFATK
ncbi:kinesin-like nuclear fusion protein, partial [Rhizopus azygosporus]